MTTVNHCLNLLSNPSQVYEYGFVISTVVADVNYCKFSSIKVYEILIKIYLDPV